jgi:hypothetical protein
MKWNQEKKYDLEESWIQTSEYVESIWSKIRKLNSRKTMQENEHQEM